MQDGLAAKIIGLSGNNDEDYYEISVLERDSLYLERTRIELGKERRLPRDSTRKYVVKSGIWRILQSREMKCEHWIPTEETAFCEGDRHKVHLS